MSDVFISHSSKDKEIADGLVEFLESRGVSCWIAPRNIVPGSDWAASISTAITSSKMFLLVYTHNSAESEQCSREMSIAESIKNISIIPYKADDAELKGAYMYYLTAAHWIGADVKKKDYKYEELYSYIAGILGKNIQNINANTYIDHLHIENAKEFPEGLSEAVKNYVGRQVEGKTDPKPEMPVKQNNRKKLPLIIACVCGVVLVAVVVVIIIIASGDSKDNPNDIRTTDLSVTEIPKEDPVTSHDDSKVTTNEEAVIQKEEMFTPTEVLPTESQDEKSERNGIALVFQGKKYTVDYYGGLNEKGQLHGEGEYSGSYSSGDEIIQITFKGYFEDGAANGMGTLKQIYKDGHEEEYIGSFANNNFNGEGTLTKTYITGDESKIIYEGIWKDGFFNGNGNYKIYYATGPYYEYNGEFINGKYNGKGTILQTWPSGERREFEGEFVNGKFEGPLNKKVYYYSNGSYEETKGVYKEGEKYFCIVTKYDDKGKVTNVQVDKPQNIHTEAATTESVTVVWDSSELDVKYHVEIYSDSSMTSKLDEKIISEDNVVMSDLSEGDSRYVRVRTEYVLNGVNYYSDWADITALTGKFEYSIKVR